MISSKFPKSFRAAGDLVVLGEFLKVLKTPRKITKKFIKHHQVTSKPKTLRKLAWNHLKVFWLNFEKNRRLIRVSHGPSPTYNQFWLYINFTDRVKKHEKDLLKQEGIPANYLVEDILELLKCVDMTKVRSQRVVKVQNSTFWTLTKDRLYHLCAMFFLRAVLLVSPTSWMVLESEHYTPKPFYSDNIGLK